MTIACINAISIREGGSLVVLRELLSRFADKRPTWTWHVATNEHAYRYIADLENVFCHVYPNKVIDGLHVRWWYEVELPRLIVSCRADILFSQTNYLPSRRLRCPTLLLVQHAGHFSDVFKRLTEERLSGLGRLLWKMKSRWVRSSVRRADRVTVQTNALADRIQDDLGISAERLIVVPHGSGVAINHGQEVRSLGVEKPIRIGYITKFGVQKNFGVLFRAAQILKSRNQDFCIILTLNPALDETREVLNAANKIGVADRIENHGEIGPALIDELYRTLDIFVFASLCESFGFPLLEAMAYGLPLVTAETPSNLEIIGCAGVLFPPHDENILAKSLELLIQDTAWYEDRSRASLERSTSFSWNKAASDTILAMENLMSKNGLES